jgi:hypothetical protein
MITPIIVPDKGSVGGLNFAYLFTGGNVRYNP